MATLNASVVANEALPEDDSTTGTPSTTSVANESLSEDDGLVAVCSSD